MTISYNGHATWGQPHPPRGLPLITYASRAYYMKKKGGGGGPK